MIPVRELAERVLAGTPPAIARAITGTRWNGWVFFGLKNHRGRP